MKQLGQPLWLAGGVNLNRDPRAIAPGQLALSKNAFPVIPGILGKRRGISGERMAINSNAAANKHFAMTFKECPYPDMGQYLAHLHTGSTTSSSHYAIASNLNNVLIPLTEGYAYTIGAGQSDYDPVKFVPYRGMIIAVVPGMEGYLTLMAKPAGGYEWIKNTFKFDPAIVNVQTSQASEVTPRNACQYKQRMVWGNFGPGKGSWVIFADKATATVMQPLFGHSLMSLVGSDVLSLNGRHVEVGSIEGENIVAMQEVTMGATGSAVESLLMLLTARSCVFISGEILQTGDTDATDPNGLFGTYQEHRVNYECGCVGQDTLVKTPYGWVWAGPDDVWLLRGNFPERIGTNIRPALLACPTSGHKMWSAAYANGTYVLQLVTTSSAVSDLFGSITTYKHEYWVLDLRDGPPRMAEEARWFGPMIPVLDNGESFALSKIATVRGSDGAERIQALAGEQSIGDAYLVNMFDDDTVVDRYIKGAVAAQEWQPYDVTNNPTYAVGDIVRPRVNTTTAGRTGRLHVCIVAGQPGGSDPTWSTSVGGNTIDNTVTWQEINGIDVAALGIRQDLFRTFGVFQADIRTVDNLLNDNTHEKLVRRVEANIAAQNKMNITCTALLDQGNAPKSLGTNSFGGESFATSFDVLGSVVGGKKSRAKSFRPAETNLIQCRSAQIKFSDETSFIIDDTNDKLVLGFGAGGDPTVYIQITIAQGNYANINAILDAIKAALNAASVTTALTAAGMTLGANPFSYSDAYVSTFPYFNNIILTTTSPGSFTYMSAQQDVTDFTVAPGTINNDLTATTAYVSRSKRLAAILGIYTSGSGSDRKAHVSSNVFRLDGTQIVHYYNSIRFDISSAVVVVQPKTSIPFKGQNRS